MSARVVVIGAGAAGLTAAIRAAEGGARVTLLNAHPKVGLKILMSGGTRCNVTHREVTERDFNAGSLPFVRRILAAFTPEQTRAWMESLGVRLKLEQTGKYFPESDDAATVLEALLAATDRVGVELVSGARVVRIERGTSESAARFRVGVTPVADSAAFGEGVSAIGRTSWPLPAVEPAQWYEADAVILATGGLSFPRTGSDGTGYALAAALGHTLEPPVPALTPLAASDPLCAQAQGLTLDAELTLWLDGKRATTIRGSFLITHFGYSGPAALDLSRHWLKAEHAPGRVVTASFLPGENAEAMTAAWIETVQRDPHAVARRWLGARLPQARLPDRLTVLLCREAGIEPWHALSQVDREHRARVIERLVARPLPITGTLGYEKAEVTAGGVNLSEVNPSTLESRLAPGLYLCGEVLDVEGRLGGFNFQWSWSSGTVAGRAAALR